MIESREGSGCISFKIHGRGNQTFWIDVRSGFIFVTAVAVLYPKSGVEDQQRDKIIQLVALFLTT